MERYEVNKAINQFNESLESITKALNITALKKEHDELANLMQKPDFWNDTTSAKKISQRANQIEVLIDRVGDLGKRYASLLEWFEISEEGSEEWSIMEEEIDLISKDINEFELEVLLDEPYDANSAILELHPGAGGTESQDWCDMLYRMYLRYASKKGFKVELMDYQAGDEAGIKSVTFLVKGLNAYGYLKAERGVHRLVRISPFDSNARRHTSFVSLDVIPEFNDDITIDIKDEDLKIDVYRSSGAGGQSVNTTDSAVRITHIPTNIVVTCQNERSQIKNRESALSLLKSKLLQLEIKSKENEIKEIKGEQKDNAFGSQIRSYVFHPYQMVKDHRTNYEVGNVDLVMDGDLDGFINAYLKGSKNE